MKNYQKVAEEYNVGWNESDGCFFDIAIAIVGTAIVDEVGAENVERVEFVDEENRWRVYMKR